MDLIGLTGRGLVRRKKKLPRKYKELPLSFYSSSFFFHLAVSFHGDMQVGLPSLGNLRKISRPRMASRTSNGRSPLRQLLRAAS